LNDLKEEPANTVTRLSRWIGRLNAKLPFTDRGLFSEVLCRYATDRVKGLNSCPLTLVHTIKIINAIRYLVDFIYRFTFRG
jgi:hypothetical protein